jgi:hypothetical protein
MLYKICVYIQNVKKLENFRLCVPYIGMFNFAKCAEENKNRVRDYSFVISEWLTTCNAVSWKQVLMFFPEFSFSSDKRQYFLNCTHYSAHFELGVSGMNKTTESLSVSFFICYI